MPADYQWTPLGVRMRAVSRTPGELNWLFIPGGPGYGSESLAGLVDIAEVPGTSWLVDLPGDGSNTDAPGAPRDPYFLWPQVLLEAVAAVPNPVYVGHSTGDEYLLSVPELGTPSPRPGPHQHGPRRRLDSGTTRPQHRIPAPGALRSGEELVALVGSVAVLGHHLLEERGDSSLPALRTHWP